MNVTKQKGIYEVEMFSLRTAKVNGYSSDSRWRLLVIVDHLGINKLRARRNITDICEKLRIMADYAKERDEVKVYAT